MLILAVAGVRYLIETVGQPGYFETIQAERPYGPGFEVTDAWRIYSPLLLGPERLPFSLGALVAVVVALVLLAAPPASAAPAPFPTGHDLLCTKFGCFAILLGLVGGTWREACDLLIIEPSSRLLVGAAGLVGLIDHLTAVTLRWVLTAAAGRAVSLLWQPA